MGSGFEQGLCKERIKKNGRPEKSSPGTLDLLKKKKKNFVEENEKAEEENDVKNKVTIPEELLTPEELRERFDRYLRGEVLDPPTLPAPEDQVHRWIVCLSKPLQKRPGLTNAELRERFHRRMEELRSTRPLPLPPPLAAAAAAEDQVLQQQQQPWIPDFFRRPRFPYAELRESNRMKKRQSKRKKKRELEAAAAGVKKQEVVVDDAADTEALTLGHVKKIGDDENKAAGRKKKPKGEKKERRNSCY